MLFIVLLVVLTAASSAQSTPKVTLSANRVPTPGYLTVQGSRFTPKRNISSHLCAPSGKEYPVLPLLTDERGAFTHEIETLVLTIGVHELWVVDDTSKVASNRVRFEVYSDTATMN